MDQSSSVAPTGEEPEAQSSMWGWEVRWRVVGGFTASLLSMSEAEQSKRPLNSTVKHRALLRPQNKATLWNDADLKTKVRDRKGSLCNKISNHLGVKNNKKCSVYIRSLREISG